MTHSRTIEIDFDVHKRIENERRGFDEPPNDALRRLLGLGYPKPVQPTIAAAPRSQRRSWSDKGVVLPHGTTVRMHYNGRTYEGQITDGVWVVGDKTFDSPSAAAGGIAVTKKGKTTLLNGWKYWEIKRPGDDTWVPLDSLRPRVELTVEELFEPARPTGGHTA